MRYRYQIIDTETGEPAEINGAQAAGETDALLLFANEEEGVRIRGLNMSGWWGEKRRSCVVDALIQAAGELCVDEDGEPVSDAYAAAAWTVLELLEQAYGAKTAARVTAEMAEQLARKAIEGERPA